MDSKDEKKSASWYDKYYKILLAVPLLIILLSLVYLGLFFNKHGDFMLKDASLSGGTTITLNGGIDPGNLESQLNAQYSDLTFRTLTDIRTGEPTSYIIETSESSEKVKASIEDILGYSLDDENSTIEFTGPTLSSSFYKQLIFALVISFILMSIVVTVLFRTFIPSLAVIFAAFADIVMPLALIDYLGIKISAAGIAAFLMLIGYSVDTDILLTNRALRSEGSRKLNQRIFWAFKTGILMTITAIIAVTPAFFIPNLPESFKQIFLILSLGLFADIINTWMTNAGIIKWYCDRKGIK